MIRDDKMFTLIIYTSAIFLIVQNGFSLINEADIIKICIMVFIGTVL